MASSLKPKVSNKVPFQLPEHIRSNDKLSKFLQYYYDHISSEGQPLDFLNNLIQYKDIDFEKNVFNTLVIRQMLNLLPPNMAIDQTLMVKKLVDFFKAKGSEESFRFIMTALFNEDVSVEWQSNNVLRPSANKFSRQSSILLKSTDSFQFTPGSIITQSEPYAQALVKSATQITYSGKEYVKVQIDDKSIQGQFTVGSSVKCLRNNINRSFFEITDYFVPSQIQPTRVTLLGSFEGLNFEGLILKQLNNPNFKATISALEGYSNFSYDKKYYVVTLSDITGAMVLNEECYIISSKQLNNHFTKLEYYNGTVSPAIDEIEVVRRGSMYKNGIPIKFEAGSGINAAATIESVTSGSVDGVIVINGGYGFSVGDKISFSGTGRGVNPAKAEVTKIDGAGAEVLTLLELDSFEIVAGGSLYNVGDSLFIKNNESVKMIQLQVSSVNSVGAITGLTITDRGVFEYQDFFEVDLSNSSVINGTGAKLNLSFKVFSINLINAGKHYRQLELQPTEGVGTGAELYATLGYGCIKASGFSVTGGSGITAATASITSSTGNGAVIVPVISAGSITGFTVIKSGSGYQVGDTVKIYANNTSASATVSAVNNGAVKFISVLKPGHSYGLTSSILYHADAGGVDCQTKIHFDKNGSLLAIDVLTEGSGYISNAPTVLNGVTLPTFNTSLAGTGIVKSANVTQGGTGYWSTSEVVPLSLTVNGTGTGAVLSPVIQNGQIIDVRILDSGIGYDNSTTISISGGGGSGAVLTPVIQDSKLSKVIVVTSGVSYKYGTKAYVIGGGGYGADIVPTVFTGISKAEVVKGGLSYKNSKLLLESGFKLLTDDYDQLVDNIPVVITVSDPTGTGAKINAEVDENGSLTKLNIINPGSGYTSPTYTISPDFSSNPDILAVLNIKAERQITSLSVVSSGSGYSSNAEVYISGEGSGAQAELVIDNNGSVTSVALTGQGSGLTTNPSYSLIDSSGYGAISEVRMTDNGSGYDSIPDADAGSKYNLAEEEIAGKSKLLSYSSTIGGVEKAAVTYSGYGYDELPWTIFPVAVIVDAPTAFIPGEIVTIKSNVYAAHDTSYTMLQEDGSKILYDTNVNLAQSYEDPSDYEFYATVYDIDYDKQIVYLTFENIGTDEYNIFTESDYQLKDESGLNFVYENSSAIRANHVLYGKTSKLSAVVIYVNRAAGNAKSVGLHHTEYKFENDAGKLNNSKIKLHNSERIQDFAYVLKSGLSLSQYQEFIKKTVHPAGWSMHGDVVLTLFGNQDVEVHLPSDTLKSLLTLYITLTEGNLDDINSYLKYDLSWLDANKFFLNSTTNVNYNLASMVNTSSGLANISILDENGDRITIGTGRISMGADDMDAYSDLQISSVPYFTADSSTEIKSTTVQ